MGYDLFSSAIEVIGDAASETIKEVGEKVAEIATELEEKGDSIFPDFFKDLISDTKTTYNDLETMKKDLGNNYRESKPPYSPDPKNWFENGGLIEIDDSDGTWTYIDSAGREVSDVDGYPVFTDEAKHPFIDDIDIGEFTGDRGDDKQLFKEKLQEEYGLGEIPDGYIVHHDSENGKLQLVKEDWHKEFTHSGGYSLYKEG